VFSIRIQDLNLQFRFYQSCREKVAQGFYQVSDDNQLTRAAHENAQMVADFI
jgi:hypothetical protein